MLGGLPVGRPRSWPREPFLSAERTTRHLKSYSARQYPCGSINPRPRLSTIFYNSFRALCVTTATTTLKTAAMASWLFSNQFPAHPMTLLRHG